jgi:hypothetical protein
MIILIKIDFSIKSPTTELIMRIPWNPPSMTTQILRVQFRPLFSANPLKVPGQPILLCVVMRCELQSTRT